MAALGDTLTSALSNPTPELLGAPVLEVETVVQTQTQLEEKDDIADICDKTLSTKTLGLV